MFRVLGSPEILKSSLMSQSPAHHTQLHTHHIAKATPETPRRTPLKMCSKASCKFEELPKLLASNPVRVFTLAMYGTQLLESTLDPLLKSPSTQILGLQGPNTMTMIAKSLLFGSLDSSIVPIYLYISPYNLFKGIPLFGSLDSWGLGPSGSLPLRHNHGIWCCRGCALHDDALAVGAELPRFRV